MLALDEVLDSIVQSIKHSGVSETVGVQYLIQFVDYDFNLMNPKLVSDVIAK